MRKTANEMTDREIIEKAFSPRVREELDRELGLREDENGADTTTTPTEDSVESS